MGRAGSRIDLRRRLLRRARPAARGVLHRPEGQGGGHVFMKKALVLATTFALLLPSSAFARGTFDPTKEFEQHEWVPIHLGPLNLSITKAVVYLMLGALGTILFGLF